MFLVCEFNFQDLPCNMVIDMNPVDEVKWERTTRKLI